MGACIGLVDFSAGNLQSVRNAIEFVGADVKICRTPADFFELDALVLPGVGAFDKCMENLNSQSLINPINEHVIAQKKPTLGICLGMQIFASAGKESEQGTTEGFGWLNGVVTEIPRGQSNLKLPHMGYNSIRDGAGCRLLKNIPPAAEFYFVHSYHLELKDSDVRSANTEYGIQICAIVEKGNIFGTQFHPEKSQDHGLAIFSNFLEIVNSQRC